MMFDDDENYVTMDAGHLSDNFLSDGEEGEVQHDALPQQSQDLGSDSQGSMRSSSQTRDKRSSSTEGRSTDVNSDSSSEESSREATPEHDVQSAPKTGKRPQKWPNQEVTAVEPIQKGLIDESMNEDEIMTMMQENRDEGNLNDNHASRQRSEYGQRGMKQLEQREGQVGCDYLSPSDTTVYKNAVDVADL